MPDVLTPLDGLRVLELGNALAASMAGLALADLGADVVRYEYDRSRVSETALYASLSRGKRVCRLGGCDAEDIWELAQGADIVLDIRCIPPGLKDVLRSDVITLALPPFSNADPCRANYPDDEGLVLAAAGVFAEQGPNNRLRGTVPAGMPMPIASAYAAAYGTLGVLAALYGRLRHGHGEAIEVPLFNALLEGFSYNHLTVEDLPERYIHPTVLQQSASNVQLPEDQVQALLDPLYRSYQTADHRWFYIATPAHKGHVERLLRALGLWEGLVADGLPLDDPYLSSKQWRDPRSGSVFAYPKLSDAWRKRLRAEVGAVMASRTCDDWEATFAAEGLCGTRVRSSAQWCATHHAREAGLIVNFEDPVTGLVAAPGPFVWQSGGLKTSARQLVRAPRWRADAWISHRKSDRHLPLDGIRVLDLCNVIAGPTVAGVLTRFGAHVTKIDPPSAGFDPFITMALSLQSARGKESLLLDIKNDAGRGAFDTLVRECDLITFNGTNSQMAELGLSLDRLSAIKSGLVVTQIAAFNGPKRGVYSDRLGVDEVLQAATGVMHRMRPIGAPPEEYAHFGTIDVVTGVWGAVGAVAGLIGAARDGHARRMETSLAAGGACVQFPFLWYADGVGHAPDPAPGDGPHPGQAGSLDLRNETSGYAGKRAYYTVGDVREPLRTYADLRVSMAHSLAPHDQPLPDDFPVARFETHRDHPSGLSIGLVSQCAITFEHTPLLTPGHPHKYGVDTREILKRSGYGEGEVTALIEAGLAAESWPNHTKFFPD